MCLTWCCGFEILIVMDNQEFNPPPAQVSSKPKIVYVLIVVLVLFFGGIGGYLLGTKKSETKIPDKNTFPIATLEPVVTPSPKDWKTYENNKYGYSLQYPSDWVIKESCFADPKTDATCLSSNDFEFDPADFGTAKGGQIRIDGKDNNINITPDSFCTTTPTTPEKCEYYSSNGLSVVKRLSAPYAMMVGLIKDNKISLVFHVKFNQTSQYETIKTFDKILSTFKFLPQGSPLVADETAGWKTYKNTGLGFEFKYPSLPNWFVREDSQVSVTLYNYDVDNAPGRDYLEGDGDLFKVVIGYSDAYSDIKSWLEGTKNNINPVTNKPTELINIKDINIDSHKGLSFEEVSYGTPYGGAVLESPRGKLVLFGAGLNYKGNKKIFEQVLSTFKFL